MPDGTDAVGVGRRKAARLRVQAEARLVTRDGAFPVDIVDISQTGVHLARPGAQDFTWCVLKWLGFEFYGSMAWSRTGRCGVRFDDPLPAEAILAIKRYFPKIDESTKMPSFRRSV